MRRAPLLLSILATIATAVVVNLWAYRTFVAQELTQSEGQLSLYRSTVFAELERHSHLTHILARDTFVTEAISGGHTGVVNARFAEFAQKSGLDAIYLMGPSGFTIAASNHASPSSFVGQNYAFRPYFKTALAGAQGRFYAIGTTTGQPGYFIADAVHDVTGAVGGVVAIKKSFSNLEESWRNAGQQVILTNQDGVVLLASDVAWRYRTLAPLSAQRRDAIGASRQFPGQELAPLDWRAHAANRAEIAGEQRLHLVADDLPNGWQLHYFASDDRAVARSWLATALVVVLAGALMIVVQVQRARRIDRALKRAEQEEMQLRVSNSQLANEVAERKAAEQQLKAAQKELEHTSRLAALGELSASVTHELGQPIAAMRNHLAAAEINPARSGALSGEITALVARMEAITRQLKFFATPSKDPFEEFDLLSAMQAAVTLLAPNIDATGVTLHWETAPQSPPAAARGNRLRIEQVMTNILRNACDAIEETAAPQLDLRLGQTDTDVWFEVADNGHGLAGASLDNLQEPFVTTRESGRGMGLGLAISANIIKDHGGTMSARDRPNGGAVFRITLPRAKPPPQEGLST